MIPSPGADPGEPTIRQEYMSAVRVRQDYGFSPLTNICGVGLFLISSDNKIILSEQSKRITVLGGRYSYTASGTMDWNPFRNVFGGRPSENLEWQQFTHPFQAVCHEAGEEVGHDV